MILRSTSFGSFKWMSTFFGGVKIVIHIRLWNQCHLLHPLHYFQILVVRGTHAIRPGNHPPPSLCHAGLDILLSSGGLARTWQSSVREYLSRLGVQDFRQQTTFLSLNAMLFMMSQYILKSLQWSIKLLVKCVLPSLLWNGDGWSLRFVLEAAHTPPSDWAHTLFPGVPQLLCVWHIKKNVQTKAQQAWRDAKSHLLNIMCYYSATTAKCVHPAASRTR
jgi:hypothetical protein